jgi:hypothetical protein
MLEVDPTACRHRRRFEIPPRAGAMENVPERPSNY